MKLPAVTICLVLFVLASSEAQCQAALRIGNRLTLPKGATDTENCDILRSTLSTIADSSSENGYVVDLQPVTYSCGTHTIEVPYNVGLEGVYFSTTIVGSPSNGVVVALDTLASLSNLYVFNTNIDDATFQVGVESASSAGLLNVSIFVNDGDQGGAAVSMTGLLTIQNSLLGCSGCSQNVLMNPTTLIFRAIGTRFASATAVSDTSKAECLGSWDGSGTALELDCSLPP